MAPHYDEHLDRPDPMTDAERAAERARLAAERDASEETEHALERLRAAERDRQASGDPETVPVDLPEDDAAVWESGWTPPTIAEYRTVLAAAADAEQLARQRLDVIDDLSQRVAEVEAERERLRDRSQTDVGDAVALRQAQALKRATASTCLSWATEALGAYLTRMALPFVGRDEAMRYIDQDLDPEKLRALAMAVAAASEAVDATERYLSWSIGQRAFGEQLDRLLNDVHAATTTASGQGEAVQPLEPDHELAPVIAAIEAIRPVADELRRGYDRPIEDR